MLKEPEIRLFGRKISLPENGAIAAGREYSGDSSNESSVDCEVSRGEEREGGGERKEGEEKQDQETEELCETTAKLDVQNPNASSESDKTPSNDDDSVSENQARPENDQSGSAKALKKPDKILPCPRCTSMDTKFCYYNNYNVNQPRHFCKSCQRYWTAGGTMRNVPVGAGRRKNKNSGPNCRHITVSEALQAAQIDAPNGFHNLNFRPNGTVLSFGPDSPLCESMASALNLAEKRALNGQGGLDSKDCSTRPGDGGKTGPVMPTGTGFPSPVPCIPGIPWHMQWNSPVPVPVPVPTICPPGYPLPYYPTPAPFWNCNVPNAWNVPWLQMPSPNAHQNGAGPGPTSPLGKHSRNGELLSPNKTESLESENSIVIPKTLRIDDPEDAAKSSIWSTLGIKCDSFRREGLFKALQAKCDEKKPMINTSPLLQANPAALSRSISFRERA